MSHTKVSQLLQARGYSLQANRKTREGHQHPDRNAQFEHIARRIKTQQRRGQPALSVDTKNKEVLGNLKRVGHPVSYFVWLPLPHEVRADAVAMALIRERISVSTAAPFATSTQVPHAIRLALGSVDLGVLRRSLETVARVIEDQVY